MSLLVVPTTSSAPSYVQNTTLEGSSYVLQFRRSGIPHESLMPL